MQGQPRLRQEKKHIIVQQMPAQVQDTARRHTRHAPRGCREILITRSSSNLSTRIRPTSRFLSGAFSPKALPELSLFFLGTLPSAYSLLSDILSRCPLLRDNPHHARQSLPSCAFR